MLDKPANLDRGISFELNGESFDVSTHPFDSLANTLRDHCGLTGTKIGCDAGDCGACTVLLDGEQVCSCLVATGQADGARITTVEVTEDAGLLGRLQGAFLNHGAAQCGICTPGMLMAATSLLAERPSPDRAEIEDALGGVLCRCTGYRKIVDAVLDVAGQGQAQVVTAPLPGEAVGARIPRADGLAKVDGSDRFAADVAPDGALWLRPIRSRHDRATFELGDLDAFVAGVPGLEAALTARDVPGHNGFGIFPHLREQPVFSEGEVRYRGETVMALVGERSVVDAIDVESLPITWSPEDAVTSIADARSASKRPVHEAHTDNVLIRGLVEKGDVEAGHAAAAVTASGAFSTSYVEHAYIEPEAGYARISENDPDRIEVLACTQAPYMDLEEVANVLGFSRDRVRIIPSACGGGFGGKLDVSVQPMLAVAAWVLKRPVRAVWSRIESMASSTKRHPSEISARMSADAEGMITAFDMEGDFNTGAYSSWGPTVAGRVPVHGTGPYHVPNVLNRSCAWYTNQCPSGAFRGFGVPQAAFAQETLLDDLALKLDIDRLEIRHRNAIRAGQQTATGQVLTHSCGLAECLEELREDWAGMLARCRDHNSTNPRIRRGAGVGCMWYGCGNTSMSNPSTMRVTLGANGRFTLYNGAVDIGQGSATIMMQICADALGVPMGAFDQIVGDTDLTADAGKTSASRQTLVSGKAAYLAGRDLRAKLLGMANVGEQATVKVGDGRIDFVEGDTRRSISLSDLADRTGDGDVLLEGTGTYDPPATALDEKGQGSPYATYGFAAQICELEVDMALGTVKVLKIVAAHDVGRAINPILVEGQIEGGIAQGLGMALMEEYVPGKTENLHDYLIPTVGDIPDIDIKIIEDPEHEGPYGAKGIGEPALVPTPPAILGAIRHAAGVTIRHLPALPHRVWQAIQESGATS